MRLRQALEKQSSTILWGDGSNAIGIETSEPETIAEKKLQIGNAIEMFYELVVETIGLFAVSMMQRS